MTVAEQGEVLRPDLAVVGRPFAGPVNEPAPRLLVSIYPSGQELEKAGSGKRWKASRPRA